MNVFAAGYLAAFQFGCRGILLWRTHSYRMEGKEGIILHGQTGSKTEFQVIIVDNFSSLFNMTE